jgi:hypothetical protein
VAWPKYKVDNLVTERPPNETSALSWLQREITPFLQTTRKVLNWAIDYLGLVQVITGDTPGPLNSKVTVSGGITKTVNTAGDGTSTMDLGVTLPIGFPGFYEDPPEPVGITDPGDSPLVPHGNHSHGPGDPSVDGEYLYPAIVVGGVWTACATIFGGYLALTSSSVYSSGWTEGPVGTWTFGTQISLASIYTSWLAGYSTPTVGDRLLNFHYNDTDRLYFQGIYEILAVGGASEYPQIRRVTDMDETSELVVGKCIAITDGAYAGHLFRFDGPESPDLETQELLFTDLGVESPPAGDTFPALSKAELVSYGASPESYEMAVTDDAYPPDVFPHTFDTPEACGGFTIPAGADIVFRAEGAYLTSYNPSASVQLAAKLFEVPASGSPIAIGTALSERITWEAGNDVTFSTQLTADHVVSPTSKLRISHYQYNVSGIAQTLNFTYNSAYRGTWVKIPGFLGAVGGTNEHDKLTVLSRALKDQHPPSACGVYQRVLEDDWSSSSVDLTDVTGMSIDVDAGESYLVDIRLLFAKVPLQGGVIHQKVALAGDATVSSCLLVHEIGSASVDSFSGSDSPRYPAVVSATYGDSGVVDSSAVTFTLSVWTIKGIIHVSGAGTVQLRAATGSGDYADEGILMLDSTMVLTRQA